MKFGRAVIELCERPDRQTHKQTNLSLYFAPVPGRSKIFVIFHSFAYTGKQPQNPPLPLSHVDPILYINAWAHPIHHAKRQLDRFTHFHTTTQQRTHWLQWVAPHSPLKLPLPFNDNHLYPIHPSLHRPHSPPQTASESIQPFCHSILSGQTDTPAHTQTDRWARRQVRNMSAYAADSDALIKDKKPSRDGRRCRMTLNFDLSKIPFVRF